MDASEIRCIKCEKSFVHHKLAFAHLISKHPSTYLKLKHSTESSTDPVVQLCRKFKSYKNGRSEFEKKAEKCEKFSEINDGSNPQNQSTLITKQRRTLLSSDQQSQFGTCRNVYSIKQINKQTAYRQHDSTLRFGTNDSNGNNIAQNFRTDNSTSPEVKQAAFGSGYAKHNRNSANAPYWRPFYKPSSVFDRIGTGGNVFDRVGTVGNYGCPPVAFRRSFPHTNQGSFANQKLCYQQNDYNY